MEILSFLLFVACFIPIVWILFSDRRHVDTFKCYFAIVPDPLEDDPDRTKIYIVPQDYLAEEGHLSDEDEHAGCNLKAVKELGMYRHAQWECTWNIKPPTPERVLETAEVFMKWGHEQQHDFTLWCEAGCPPYKYGKL